MSSVASAHPVHPAEAQRIADEIRKIEEIYTTRYPGDGLDLVLQEGENPLWADPVIIDGRATFRPQHLTARYLGHIQHPGTSPHARRHTVILRIPRPATPAEIANPEQPWHPIRPLSGLFRLWPMGYEYIRHQAEVLRKLRAPRRVSFSAHPFGQGSVMLPPDPQGPDSSKRPAILIGFHWLEVGGAEKLAFDCVDWALAAGLRVIVVASVPSVQRLADRLPDHPDVSFLRLDRYLPHDQWPLYLQELARVENIRLIHIHHCVPLYDALAHLRVTAPWVKVIDSTHVIEYADGGFARLSGVWTNYIDTHHVISRELVDFLQDRFHVTGKVRLGRMLSADDKADLPPLNMKRGQKSLHVSFVGRMYYQKRPVVMVEILRALDRWAQKNAVTLSATIVGEGPLTGTVQTLVNRYGLADKVSLQHAGTDVPALLKRSDILLLPSNNEGLALVCYEAIQHGCIPLATDVGSQSEIVAPDLLLPHQPFATRREAVRAVDRLWREPGFLERQEAALHQRFNTIASDPTAEEVLMPIYQAAAGRA